MKPVIYYDDAINIIKHGASPTEGTSYLRQLILKAELMYPNWAEDWAIKSSTIQSEICPSGGSLESTQEWTF